MHDMGVTHECVTPFICGVKEENIEFVQGAKGNRATRKEYDYAIKS